MSFSTVEEKKGVGLILKSSQRMINREPKSVLQLHRIQEAQREKICCEIPSRNAIHDRLCGTVCGFRRRSKETPPARSQASPGPFLRSVWRGSNPLRKTSRIRPVPRSVPRVGFPRQTTDNTGERNEAGESPDALCARPVTSTRSAGGFSGASNSAVFSWPIAR